MKVKLTPQTNEEIIKSVEMMCEGFKFIPDSEKYTMALYCAGMTPSAISGLTGKTEGSVDAVIQRYKEHTSQITPLSKMDLTIACAVNSLPSFMAVASDKKKIADMNPMDATKTMQMMMKLLVDFVGLRKKIKDEIDSFGMNNFDEFARRLENGKDR